MDKETTYNPSKQMVGNETNRETPWEPTRPKALSLIPLALIVVIFGLLCYTIYDLKTSKRALEQQLNRTIEPLGRRLESTENRLADLRTDLDAVRVRVGVTKKELDMARAQAQRLRQEQEKTKQQLSRELQQKADATQLSALQQESANKIGAVSSDVTAVKGEVGNVKTDLASTRRDLETARREIVDARDYLSQQIARNRDELDLLRRKGERDFFEFDINRKNSARKVGDVYLTLKKADVKKRRYDVVVSADDNQLEKKQRGLNEPVQFLVGKSRLRYELVVYTISKDRIAGYLSVPKDRTLAAERP